MGCLTQSLLLSPLGSYLAWGSADGSFPCPSTRVGNTTHSLPVNSSRSGRGRSHLQREAQSRRRRAGSRAAPARAGAAAGSRCARAGGRRRGRQAGRAGARAARALPRPPRTLAGPPPAASRWLPRVLDPAAAAGPHPAGPPRRPQPRPPGTAGAFLEPPARGEPPAASRPPPPRRSDSPPRLPGRSAFRPHASALPGAQPVGCTLRRALQLFRRPRLPRGRSPSPSAPARLSPLTLFITHRLLPPRPSPLLAEAFL